MFSNEELRDSWNELFPDCKIRETDLSQPTETFFTKSLVAYLQKFGFIVEAPYNINMELSVHSREKRLFQIKVAHQIGHFLKITDESYTFYYYDLIKPTPKKTSHTLGILLNYLYYYNIYQIDVFSMAEKKLKAFEEMQKLVALAREENEQCKNKAAELQNDIASCSEQLPNTRAELDALNARNSEQKDKLQNVQDALKNLTLKHDELQAQKRQLQKQIVPDNETLNLKIQIRKLQEKLDVIKKHQETIDANICESKNKFAALQEQLQTVENTKRIIPLKFLKEFKEASDRLKDMENQAMTLNSDTQKLQEIIKTQELALKSSEKKLNALKALDEKEKSQKLQLIKQELSTREAQTLFHSNLEKQEHRLSCEIQEQQKIGDYLQEKITKFFNRGEEEN